VVLEGVDGNHVGADADACADADLTSVVGHTQAICEHEEGDFEEGQRADGGQDDGFEGLHGVQLFSLRNSTIRPSRLRNRAASAAMSSLMKPDGASITVMRSKVGSNLNVGAFPW